MKVKVIETYVDKDTFFLMEEGMTAEYVEAVPDQPKKKKNS